MEDDDVVRDTHIRNIIIYELDSYITGNAYSFVMNSLFSFSKMLVSVPMCGRISTANSSRCLRASFGVLPIPTPAGVPVTMTVPGGRVVPCDSQLIIFGTEKMRSLGNSQYRGSCLGDVTYSVPLSWYTSPFLRPRM